jgi:alkanesulfonate monooxygenase SsuD/methylene tetrahydromethanopterin reductase-like flavin-dependent oxidoreductase (luciferase family)
MHIGLMMECDCREGRTQREAFDEAFTMAEAAETGGFDGVWLAERHFAPPGGTGPIPSVVSAPLVFPTATAARSSRLRVGTAVLVLLLGHPVRMAEQVATLDNISQGRFDLGIGRSSFPRSYEGYDLPGDGDVVPPLPIYVAHTMERALSEPEASTMHHYTRLRQALLRSAGEGEARATRAARLTTLTYEDVVREWVVFGTPERVAQRLQTLREALGLSGCIMEANIGGRIPPQFVFIRLFGREVAARWRASAA